MIGYIKGKVQKKTLSYALIETNNVGFIIYCTPNHLSKLRENKESEFYTFLDVKENSLTLYGFENSLEVDIFTLVQTVSGVGAKTALSILSIFSPGEFVEAINTENITAIKNVPGIGNKAAQRLVLELKEKVATVHTTGKTQSTNLGKVNTEIENNVSQALVSLGWKKQNANSAIEKALAGFDKDSKITEEKLLRDCLRLLGKN